MYRRAIHSAVRQAARVSLTFTRAGGQCYYGVWKSLGYERLRARCCCVNCKTTAKTLAYFFFIYLFRLFFRLRINSSGGADLLPGVVTYSFYRTTRVTRRLAPRRPAAVVAWLRIGAADAAASHACGELGFFFYFQLS